MRNIYVFMVLVLFTITASSQTTTTYRSETIDGNNSFNQTYEKFNTTRAQISGYVTWDEDSVYIAFSGNTPAGPLTDGGRGIHIYFDTDPQLVPTTGTGTTTGRPWGWNPTLPFTANYHYVFEVNGLAEFKAMYNGASWSTQEFFTQNFNGAGYWEVRIRRSDLGNPSQMSIVAYIQEQWTGGSITGGIPRVCSPITPTRMV